VFTLSKDRLRKIDFVNNPAPGSATTAGLIVGGSSVTTVQRSAGSTSATTPAHPR
jgi:hypothetical protein